MTRLRFGALLGILLVSLVVPGPAQATGITDNLAGRPLSGDAHTDCQGVAYGRVNNQHVLFFPLHCMGGRYNTVANGDNGSRIGIFGPDPAVLGAGDTRDLGYIVLDAGAHPATYNQVFKGTGFWTITVSPTTSLNCANITSKLGATGNQNWQPTATSTNAPRQGTFLSVTGGSNCIMWVNIQYQPTTKDSGSPLVLSTNTNTVVGLATTHDASGHLGFSNVAEGLAVWNAYWVAHGSAGAALCITSSC